ncbi:hypothetical protein MNBD_ALPHA12-2063 [hydrothermal vent metagenome]|uniref:Uncharacterized protein n=1 Tax=hydrothermal vent metagenome TaxID=652676 RepID=A0A3B0U921_9ZZZZ
MLRPLFYSRRRWPFQGLPGTRSFMHAAVAGYARFPGTRSFMHAAVAGYAHFPGTPAMGGTHTWNGKEAKSKILGVTPLKNGVHLFCQYMAQARMDSGLRRNDEREVEWEKNLGET